MKSKKSKLKNIKVIYNGKLLKKSEYNIVEGGRIIVNDEVVEKYGNKYSTMIEVYYSRAS